MSGTVLPVIWDATWQAAMLGLLVLGVRWAVGRRLPARWQFALWFVVLIRLSAVPLPQSRFSVFNFFNGVPSAVSLGHGQGRSAPTVSARSEAGELPGRAVILPAGDVVRGETREAVTARPAATPAKSQWPWQAILLVGYLGGVLVVGIQMVLANEWLRRVMRGAQEVREGAAVELLGRARRTMGIRRRVPLLAAERLSGPALVGLWRPRLALPGRLLEECGSEELYFIFLHELAHLRRRDVLLNYWMGVLGAAHWFNPLVWVFLWRMRADRELACDEMVMQRSGDAAGYGQTLLKLLDLSGAVRRAPGALGMIETRSMFKRRIQMIAAFRRTPGWVMVPALGLMIVVAGATLTSAVTKGAAAAAGKAEAAGTQAAIPESSTPSADECLKREIKKLKVLKEKVAGGSDVQKKMQGEVDDAIAYLDKYVGKPMPGNHWNTISETFRDRTLVDIYSQLQYRGMVDVDIEKQPLAAVYREMQELRYDGVNASVFDLMDHKIDPRPNIVSYYEGEKLYIDWKTLEMAGVRPDALVSVKMAKNTPYNAFCEALTSLNAEKLVVDENEYPDYAQVKVVYNVRDLLAPVPSKKAGRMSEPGTPEELIRAIQTAVSPEWWDEVEHSQTRDRVVHKNKIVEFKGIMTVTTTAKIHGEIAAFLDKLRQADREDGAGAIVK